MAGNHGFNIKVTARFRCDGRTFSWEHKSIHCRSTLQRVQTIAVSMSVGAGSWTRVLWQVERTTFDPDDRISMSDSLMHSSHPEHVQQNTIYHTSVDQAEKTRLKSAGDS
jgi:hypothetical protein